MVVLVEGPLIAQNFADDVVAGLGKNAMNLRDLLAGLCHGLQGLGGEPLQRNVVVEGAVLDLCFASHRS